MKLENYGCEYVNSQIFWKDFLPGREIDGETREVGFLESARNVPGVYESPKGKLLTNNEHIVIPVEGRTSIQVLKDENGNIIKDEEGNRIESRKFNGAICGASFAIPQLVGYFALARQMNPTMSLETFVNKAREHAKVNSNGQLFIEPTEVIEKMREEQRTKKVVSTRKLGQETLKEQKDTDYIDETEKDIEKEPELSPENYHSKISYFHDQKSDLYYSEQRIGKATVNTQTKNKDKAYDKVLNKVHERTHPEEIHEHTMGPQNEM